MVERVLIDIIKEGSLNTLLERNVHKLAKSTGFGRPWLDEMWILRPLLRHLQPLLEAGRQKSRNKSAFVNHYNISQQTGEDANITN